MLCLSRFTFPSQERESVYFHGPQRQCYNTAYPFGIIARFDAAEIEFEPVTILESLQLIAVVDDLSIRHPFARMLYFFCTFVAEPSAVIV